MRHYVSSSSCTRVWTGPFVFNFSLGWIEGSVLGFRVHECVDGLIKAGIGFLVGTNPAKGFLQIRFGFGERPGTKSCKASFTRLFKERLRASLRTWAAR